MYIYVIYTYFIFNYTSIIHVLAKYNNLHFIKPGMLFPLVQISLHFGYI